MKKILSALAALAIPLSILPMTQTPVKATTALYQDIRVDADCGGTDCGSMTLASANTTRKLAVTADGTIYAVFYGSNGIWVTKSTDRGASFASGVQVSSTQAEPEIGAAANGTLYVIWRDGNFVVSKSTDGGATWGTPVDTGTAGTMGPAHMAVDGDYIYAVDRSGSVLMYSHDAGATWGSTSTGSSYVYADVRVDRLTHDVYVLVDNPSVFWFKSTDRGVTLSSANSTGKSVFYSVGAMTSDGTNLYFYMAGSGANLERVDLGGGAALTQTVTGSSDSQGRSLAADNCGNVVSGHKSGADLYFQYSTDSGSTFSTQELVVTAGDRANASINETNGDVMFLYEKSGDIFLSTYSGLLTGGSNCYVASFSLTAIEFDAAGETNDIVIENTSGSDITVDSISITGTDFTISENCGATIPAGGSCTISVTGENQADETLTISLNGTARQVPVSMGAIAEATPAPDPAPSPTPSPSPSPSPAPAPAEPAAPRIPGPVPPWPWATAGTDSVLLEWDVPWQDGKGPITGYRVRSIPEGASCVTTELSCVITGLEPRVEYTFAVSAQNSEGWGPEEFSQVAVMLVEAQPEPVVVPEPQPEPVTVPEPVVAPEPVEVAPAPQPSLPVTGGGLSVLWWALLTLGGGMSMVFWATSKRGE
jgi:hypothetical protein